MTILNLFNRQSHHFDSYSSLRQFSLEDNEEVLNNQS